MRNISEITTKIPNNFQLSESDAIYDAENAGDEMFYALCEIRESLEYGVCEDEFKSCEVELFAEGTSFNSSSCTQYITTTTVPDTTTAATAETTTTKIIPTTEIMPSPTEAVNFAVENINIETKSSTRNKSQSNRKRRSAESSLLVIFTTFIKSDLSTKLVVQTYNANLKELGTQDPEDLPFPLPNEIFDGENGVDVEIDYNVIIEDYTTASIDDIEIAFMAFFSVGGAILIILTLSAFVSSIAKGLLTFFGLLCFGKFQSCMSTLILIFILKHQFRA